MATRIPMMFMNRDGKSLCTVTEVNASFARLEIQNFGTRLNSSYAMPIKEYDARFGATWRPATADDLVRALTPNDTFRLPEVIPDDWDL